MRLPQGLIHHDPDYFILRLLHLTWFTTPPPPPPSNHCSRAQTSNIGIKSTHCNTVPCLQQMYVATVCIPADLNNYPSAGVAHILYMFICTLFPVIFVRNSIWVTSTVLLITYEMAHDSDLNNRTICTTNQYKPPKTWLSAPSHRSNLPDLPKPYEPSWCTVKYLDSRCQIGPGVFPDTWTVLPLPPVHLPLSHINWNPSTRTYGPTPHKSIITTSLFLSCNWMYICASPDWTL